MKDILDLTERRPLHRLPAACTMAEAPELSIAGDSPSKSKLPRRRTRPNKAAGAASAGVSGKDVQTGPANAQEEHAGESSTLASTEKRKKKKKSQVAPSQTASTVTSGSAQSGTTATASGQIENTTVNAVKTASSKGKGKLSSQKSTSQEQSEGSKLPFLRLSEPLGKSARLAPVFSHDGR